MNVWTRLLPNACYGPATAPSLVKWITLLTLLHFAFCVFSVLQRELKKLPELLSSSWAARSPLSLATSMPRIVTLLEPISLDEMRARAAQQRGSDRAAQGVIAPKAALCLLLSGKLYEDAAVKVTIEALEDGKPSLSDEMESADSASPLSKVTLSEHNVAVTSEVGMGEATHQSCQQASGFDDGEVAVGSRRLVVSVEIPARGPRLKQITGLLAELQLDVTSGSVAMNGKLATDTFHVRYRGALSLRVLAATLRAKLRTALQLSALVPGDTIEASRTRPFTIHANASGGAAPSSMGDLTDSAPAAAAAAEATDEGATIADAPLLGLLDLRALARELARPALVLDGGAAPEHPESELWLRYLQVHAPGLLASLAPTPATPQATTAPTTEEWLSALRGFMMLSLRRSIGGPQLLDGVQMGDLQLGTILGEGAYGQVYLARHKVLPDRWYAVKRQQLDAAMQTSHVGKQQLRYLEREREVLMLLARESRGKQEINLFVQLVTHSQDAASLQLAMTAVLGGELFQILEETGPMKESEVQFYAANVVQALEHLHSRGIAYRYDAAHCRFTSPHCPCAHTLPTQQAACWCVSVCVRSPFSHDGEQRPQERERAALRWLYARCRRLARARRLWSSQLAEERWRKPPDILRHARVYCTRGRRSEWPWRCRRLVEPWRSNFPVPHPLHAL